MGTCISTKTSHTEQSIAVKEPVRSNAALNSYQESLINAKPLAEKEKYKEMPEIEDKFVGDGIRRMKAFKCDLKIDQLQKLQEEFWSKTNIFKIKVEKISINKSIWKSIKQICQVDEGII